MLTLSKSKEVDRLYWKHVSVRPRWLSAIFKMVFILVLMKKNKVYLKTEKPYFQYVNTKKSLMVIGADNVKEI